MVEVYSHLVVPRLSEKIGRSNNQVKGMLMKVYPKKAYDSAEWRFLQDLLEALNFPSHFVNCVMECVTTPKFTLMINTST